jgi:chromosome segregation ATPase
MSEVTNEFFMEVHVKSHESILLDNIRRLAESLTKIAFLEKALNECRVQIDELSKQNNQSQQALQQAVNGLQAVTHERDKLTKDLAHERDELKIAGEQFSSYKKEAERKYNELTVSYNEVQSNFTELNSKVEGYVSDNSTLKKNYNRVLEELNNLRGTLPDVSEEAPAPNTNIISMPSKRKDKKSSSEDWVDAD